MPLLKISEKLTNSGPAAKHVLRPGKTKRKLTKKSLVFPAKNILLDFMKNIRFLYAIIY